MTSWLNVKLTKCVAPVKRNVVIELIINWQNVMFPKKVVIS
jgi:hypothetical protein